MFTTSKAITLLSLSLKSTLAIKTFISSVFSFKTYKPYFCIVPSVLRFLKDLAKTTRRVDIIEKPIVVHVAPDFKVIPWPLGSIRVKPYFETIKTTTDHWSKKIGTWVKLLITIIIKKSILLTNAQNLISQKSSISFNNIHNSD